MHPKGQRCSYAHHRAIPPKEATPVPHEIYEVLFVSGASVVAYAFVRFCDRLRRRAIERQGMKRMLAVVCK